MRLLLIGWVFRCFIFCFRIKSSIESKCHPSPRSGSTIVDAISLNWNLKPNLTECPGGISSDKFRQMFAFLVPKSTGEGMGTSFPQRKNKLLEPWKSWPRFHKWRKTSTIISIGRSTFSPDALQRFPEIAVPRNQNCRLLSL